jgi:hypothetical protein
MSHNSSFYFFIERIIMPTVEHRINFDNIIAGVKNHIKRHQVIYSLGAGIGIAGITAFIMRDIAFTEPISSSVTGTANSSVTGIGNKVVMKNVSFISSLRQGPPSWVIRCKETGQIFTSQREASLLMNITETNLSKHLNGLQATAEGWHFERICMAA